MDQNGLEKWLMNTPRAKECDCFHLISVPFRLLITNSNHDKLSWLVQQEGTIICSSYMEVTIMDRLLTQQDGQLPMLEDCTIARQILDRVGDKWSVLIIVNLGVESLRFKELQRRSGGISQRMLTQTLRHLERDGIVWRKATPTVPLTVEYGLTALGESLLGPLTALVDWVNRNIEEIAGARISYDCGHSGADTAEFLNETKAPPAAGAIGAE